MQTIGRPTPQPVQLDRPTDAGSLCGICLESLTPTQQPPPIDLCQNHHPMHANCVNQYLANVLEKSSSLQDFEAKIPCPTCREPFKKQTVLHGLNNTKEMVPTKLKHLHLTAQQTQNKLNTQTMLAFRAIQRNQSLQGLEFLAKFERELEKHLIDPKAHSLMELHHTMYHYAKNGLEHSLRTDDKISPQAEVDFKETLPVFAESIRFKLCELRDMTTVAILGLQPKVASTPEGALSINDLNKAIDQAYKPTGEILHFRKFVVN